MPPSRPITPGSPDKAMTSHNKVADSRSVNSSISPEKPAMTSPRSEAEIEARISRIQARNEELRRRHEEVEADRRTAQKQDSTKKADNEEEEAFRNPYKRERRPDAAPNSNGGRRRSDGSNNWREAHSGSSTKERLPVHMRLGERGAPPPPDPGYSFLSDRLRDCSDEEDRENRPLRTRGGGNKGGRGDRRDRRGSNETRSGGGRREMEEERRNGPNGRINSSPFQEQRATTPNSSGNGFPDNHSPVVSRSERRGGNRLDTQNKARFPIANSSSSVQGRLERARMQSRQLPVQDEGADVIAEWKCPDPNCQLLNAPGSLNCRQCNIEWTMTAKGRKVKQDSLRGLQIHVDLIGNDQKTGPNPTVVHNELAPEPTTQIVYAEEVAPAAGHLAVQETWQEQEEDWRNSPTITDWSEEVIKEIPISPEVVQPHQAAPMEWGHQPVSYPAQQQHQPYQPSPYQADPGLYVPYDTSSSYMVQQQPHYNGGGAMTHLTHAPMHTPIMMAQPMGVGLEQQQQHHMHQQYYQPQEGYAQQYIPPQRRYDGGGQQYDRGGSSGGRAAGFAYRDPAKAVSKIPPRFQKQRQAQKQEAKSEDVFKLPPDLPRSSSKTAPKSCRHLAIFSAPAILEAISADPEIAETVNAPVKTVPASTVRELYSAVASVDPKQDRHVLIHVGGIDALDVSKRDENDVEKGFDSDKIADALCDLVEDLVNRIPYIDVYLSMLTPRCDRSEQGGMSLPNSVRRVMNVQISSRLFGNDNVHLVNNDEVLDWCKDEEKRDRVLMEDGCSLTVLGKGVMVRNWVEKMTDVMGAIKNEAEAEEAVLTQEVVGLVGDVAEMFRLNQETAAEVGLGEAALKETKLDQEVGVDAPRLKQEIEEPRLAQEGSLEEGDVADDDDEEEWEDLSSNSEEKLGETPEKAAAILSPKAQGPTAEKVQDTNATSKAKAVAQEPVKHDDNNDEIDFKKQESVERDGSSQEDEFHEAAGEFSTEGSPAKETTSVPAASGLRENRTEDFLEKENEEKMEKELFPAQP